MGRIGICQHKNRTSSNKKRSWLGTPKEADGRECCLLVLFTSSAGDLAFACSLYDFGLAPLQHRVPVMGKAKLNAVVHAW